MGRPEVRDLHMTRPEELEMYEKYIPQYVEDGAPVSIMLANTLVYASGEPECHLCAARHVGEEEEGTAPSCCVLQQSFFIGAEYMVAPCTGMCNCNFADQFPSLFETPLKEILRDPEFLTLCAATVKDVRDHSPKCRTCPYLNRCTGGCRNSVLMQGDDYYGIDKNLCHFFENGWEERRTSAIEEPFRMYLQRNPPAETSGTGRWHTQRPHVPVTLLLICSPFASYKSTDDAPVSSCSARKVERKTHLLYGVRRHTLLHGSR